MRTAFHSSKVLYKQFGLRNHKASPHHSVLCLRPTQRHLLFFLCGSVCVCQSVNYSYLCIFLPFSYKGEQQAHKLLHLM